MPKSINPLELTNPDDIKLLRTLLENNRFCAYWPKDKVFTVLGQEIALTHTLLAKAIRTNLIYRILSNNPSTLDQGTTQLNDVLCSLSFS